MKVHKRLIYGYLKFLAKAGLWVYFKKRTVVGNRDHLKEKRPTILVSNHPNTLLDPINVAVKSKMQVHFLANAGLFLTRIGNWFFNTLYCIPIARKEDKPNRFVDNNISFDRCDQFLESGGCLFIAPEGTSWMDRMMRPFKTGTARIAFSVAEKVDFDLDLVIQPVGVGYSAPDRFRSKVFMQIGEPIKVREFREDYEKNPYETVNKLTDQIEEQIRAMIIDTESEEEDLMIKRLEEMLQNRAPADDYGHFKRVKALIEHLRVAKANQPEEFAQLEKALATYFADLENTKTADVGVASEGYQKWWKLIPGFPVFLFGVINNAIPSFLIWWGIKKMNLYIGYNSGARILLGLIVVPFFYSLQTYLVYSFLGWYIAIAYLISLLPLGMFAADFWKEVQRFWKIRKYNSMAQSIQENLQQGSKKIMEQVQQFQSITVIND